MFSQLPLSIYVLNIYLLLFFSLQIETVKEEFSDHLEVVDKINQICKNLQYHLNKMKTFEDPPFEKEANAIVDRWLDVCGQLIN